MESNKLVAMPDAQDTDLIGAIVFWSLSGGLDLERLRESWEDAGLDSKHLPDPPSSEVAFSRACKQLSHSRRLVRPLEDGGWAIVTEEARGGALSHSTDLTVHLDVLKRITGSPDNHPLLDRVREEYAFYTDHLIQQDVSAWLCKTVDRLEASALRGTGGVYFVPAHTYKEWLRIKACVKIATSHTCHNIPAVRTEDAIEAALAAVSNEVKASLDKLSSDLAAHKEAVTDGSKRGKLGNKALASRIEAAERVESKLERYEALLGRALPGLHDQLQGLRAQITVSMLTGAELVGSDDSDGFRT